MNSAVVVLTVVLILGVVALLVTLAINDNHISQVNTCRASGYTDLIRWDGVLYCVEVGETNDVISGMKYELVMERD